MGRAERPDQAPPLFDVASLTERVQKRAHGLFHMVKIVRIVCFQCIPETAQSIIRIVDLISGIRSPTRLRPASRSQRPQ